MAGGKWECVAWRGEGGKTKGAPDSPCNLGESQFPVRECSSGRESLLVGGWAEAVPGSKLHSAGYVRRTSVDSLRRRGFCLVSLPPECL